MKTRNLLTILATFACLTLIAGIAQGQACPVSGCVQGTAGPDVMTGTAGADCLCGLGGNDIIRGGAGPDDLYGNGGSDCVFGDEDNDDAWGGNGSDTVHGNDDHDNVYGANGNDCVFGDNGIDLVDGGAGTDVCRTGPTFFNCENLTGQYFCVKVIGGGGTYGGPGDIVPAG